jgi:hypothetical protein
MWFTLAPLNSGLMPQKKLLSGPLLKFSPAPPSPLKIVTHRCQLPPAKGVERSRYAESMSGGRER